MELIKKYNVAVRNINNLELNKEDEILEEVGNHVNITIEDVEYMENHYIEMNERYKELELGIYSLVAE